MSLHSPGLCAGADGPGADGPGPEDRIAVVGMAGRFPGASDVDMLWKLSVDGDTGVVTTGVPGTPGSAYGVLPDTDRFDAAHFGIPEHEAALIDPQQRVFLEVVQHAIDDAGLDPAADGLRTSVYAATAPNLGHNTATTASARYEWDLANGVDYVATRVAYRLGLRGEAITIQTACSSSLVAVHLAAQSLLSGQSDLALAGGVSISADQTGYMVEEGMIASPTGACRPFDVAADGTVPGSGAAAVVLKRLPDALRDGDRIRAVILGSAINNDGGTKAGFMAPSPTGQSEVIANAHAVARIEPRSIGYVETHGTATRLGDQIEIEGLRRAFGPVTGQVTALGSMKANCGHLDRAAGVSGLIRAVLVLEHATIPPMAGCTLAAPELDLPGAGLTLPTGATSWPKSQGPRRAGVSAFGVGGTNAHVVLEQAPALAGEDRILTADRPCLWLISAHSPESLRAWSSDLDPGVDPNGVGAALANRRPRQWRAWRVWPDDAKTDAKTAAIDPVEAADDPQVVFAFPGQGETVVDGMPDLYDGEPVYRQTVDRCARIVHELAGWDPRGDLYAPMTADERAALYTDMSRFQPALFTVEWALVQLWRCWGVRPAAVIGHSIGEVTAAACAGVLSEADALALVVERSRLMEQTPLGASLTVGMSAKAVSELLINGLELASDNGEELSVVTGPRDAVSRLEQTLAERGVFRHRLNIRHSPHGSTMARIAGQLSARLAGLSMSPPATPLASNVSGDWVGAEIADPLYWGRQLRSTVRFREQLERVSSLTNPLVVVLGPGAGFARMVEHELSGRVAGVVHPYGSDLDTGTSTRARWLGAVGQAWAHGLAVDTSTLCPGTGRQRIILPPTKFDHTVRWPRPHPGAVTAADAGPPERYTDPGAWLTRPAWRPVPPGDERRAVQWVLPADASRRAWFDRLGRAAEMAGRTVLEPIAHLGMIPLEGPADLLWWPDTDGELLARAAAVIDQTSGGDVRLWVLEPRSADLEGSFGGAHAATRVLPQEFPGTRANLVRITGGPAEPGTVAGLLATRLDGSVFSVDGERAWVREHQQVWPGWSPRALRVGGCYLITGGLGRVGQAVTHALSRLTPATFEVIGRRPEQEADAEVATLRNRIGPSSRVNYTRLDVTQQGELAAYLEQLRTIHGRIDGVVHTAGMTDRHCFRLAADTTPAEFAAIRAAKVRGTLALAAGLRPDDADFVLLCSSLSVVLGGVQFGAYVSANVWQSEFARRRYDDGDRRWVSVEWDAWLPVGQARGEGPGAGPAYYALSDDDGHQVLRRVLACDDPVVTVSTAPLPERLAEIRRQIGADMAGPATGAAGALTDPAAVANTVRRVLAEVLGNAPASDDTDLRNAGVESLTILQIVGRLRTALGVRISLADAMRALSINGLSRLALGGRAADGTARSALAVVRLADGRAHFPTTPTQRRWLELFPEGYGGIDLVVDVGGAVGSERLRDAVRQTIERHSGLRTVFSRGQDWTQSVRPTPEVPLTDLTGLAVDEQLRIIGEAAREAEHRWFDVELTPPFEVELFALGPDRHALLIHAYHVLFDGWSSSIFLRDVARVALLDDAPGPEPLQYTDYAVAQREYLAGEAFRQERAYWQDAFRGAPGPTRLPGRDGEPGAGDRGEMLPFAVPTTTWRNLGELAIDRGTTRFALLMSAYSMVVYEESCECDMVIGTTAAGRPTPQTEEIIGVFVNPLPIRLRVDPAAPVAEYVQHVHDVLVGLHEHGNYPLEDLVAEVEPFIGMGLNDTFYCYLLYQNYWRPDGHGLDFRPLPTPGVQHKLMRDTEIVLAEQDDVINGEFWWRPVRFSADWARRSLSRFIDLLSLLADEDTYPRRLDEVCQDRSLD